MAILDVTFFSQVLVRNVRVKVILPTDHEAFIEQRRSEPLKTLYLLHGYAGNCDEWITMMRTRLFASEYNLCIVMPEGCNKIYCDSELSGDRYGTFIGQELVEATRRMFPLSRKREDTFIGGYSMGGFGAIVNALRNTDTFGYVTAFSAALMKRVFLASEEKKGSGFFTRTQWANMFGLRDIRDYPGSENDYEFLAAKAVREGWPLPDIYMDCGTKDDLLYEANIEFRDYLRLLDYHVTWSEREAGHEWTFWDESIRRALDFLPVERLEFRRDSKIQAAIAARDACMIKQNHVR